MAHPSDEMQEGSPPSPARGSFRAGRVPLSARLSHRLARHVPVAPARLADTGPRVSFTFDDVPASACTNAADLLSAYDARATYYVSGDLIGTDGPHWRHADADMIADLHAAGHEIGCHTCSHAFLPDLTRAAVVAEARRNAERLRQVVPTLAMESFALPFGFGSLAAKRALGRLFASSRSIVPGLNVGLVDRQFLRANPLIEGSLDAAGILRLLDAAVARRGWVIFYGHDVVADPSPFGCTPALLEAALRAAADRGIPRVAVAEGLRGARPRAAAG